MNDNQPYQRYAGKEPVPGQALFYTRKLPADSSCDDGTRLLSSIHSHPSPTGALYSILGKMVYIPDPIVLIERGRQDRKPWVKS